MTDHVRGTDEAPRFRSKADMFAACEWRDHLWYRYINIGVGNGETMFILCDGCGRTPYEALSKLRIYNDV